VPAYAVVEKSGSRSCGSNQHIDLESLGYGTVKHYAPTGNLQATYQTVNAQYRRTHTNQTSSSWRITSTGGLSNDFTGAFCDNVAP